MDMPVLLRNQIPFSQTPFTREPLPIDLAELQRRKHRTLEEYLGYVFAETRSKLVLPVLDASTCHRERRRESYKWLLAIPVLRPALRQKRETSSLCRQRRLYCRL